MIAEFNIAIEGTELNCDVVYSRYRESDLNEAEIIIIGIFLGKISVLELVEEKELEKLKDKCEKHYQHQIFIVMRNRK